MKPPADNDPLLDDVLAEAAPPEFRNELLQTTLWQARRRRQFRRGRQVLLGIAMVGLLGVWAARQTPRSKLQTLPVASQSDFPLVIVRTEPLPAEAFVNSAPLTEAAFVTTIAGQYRVINDEELLALAAPAPVALIRCGPDCAQLVFVNPADRERLLAP